ncbi:MAG TPA: glycosyltransferase family 4 protein [Terriglobales bacterium]|jgi:glycosyltransferase involved in cell wall biosynthesis
MRITILTQYYPPEIGAPQGRLSDLAERIVRAGHQVHVLTAMPSYPQGRIYPGYGGLMSRELHNGVEIVRSFVYPTRSVSTLPRLANYFSFLLSSSMLGSFALDHSDYLMVESPPLFLGVGGIWLSRLKRARLIFNVSDLWPDSAVHLGVISRDSRAYRVGRRLESICYRRAWLVTGQSQGILDDIHGRFCGIHTLLLSNGSDTGVFNPIRRSNSARARLTRSREFVVLYAGLHGIAQGLGHIIEAAKRLTGEEGYRFVFIGDGPEKADLIAGAEGCDNVTFMDPVPLDQMPELLASADVLLVPLARDLPGAVPSKLYEAMASGRPLVLMANGEPAAIVNRHQAGVVVSTGDVPGLVNALRSLRADPARASTIAANARCAAVKYYDRAQIAAGFIAYLEKSHSDASRPEI